MALMEIGWYAQLVLYYFFGSLVLAGIITCLVDPKRRVAAGQYDSALFWSRICWWVIMVSLGLTVGLLFRGYNTAFVWVAIVILGWVLWRDGAFIEEIKRLQRRARKPTDHQTRTTDPTALLRAVFLS